MDEEIKPIEQGQPGPVKSRPVFLTALCLFSFVYFGLLTLLLFLGLFNSGWITGVMNQYLETAGYTKMQTIIVFGAGFLLHGLGFTGILLIWNLRKTGYYLLGLSCLVIAAYQLLNPMTAITSTAAYIIFILLFGIFFNSLKPISSSKSKR
jgi:hypothetical protein